VAAAPSNPAPISVVCAPTAALTGPVSASESGSRPVDTSPSRLEIRPSRCGGTWRCLAVAQTIRPAVSKALKTRLTIISCQTDEARP